MKGFNSNPFRGYLYETVLQPNTLSRADKEMVCWNVWASSKRYGNSDKISGVWITSERLVSATRFWSEICKCGNRGSEVRGIDAVLCFDLGPSARFLGAYTLSWGEETRV